MSENCQICGKSTSSNLIRLGVCWDCANFESIMSEGLDMNNKGLLKDGNFQIANTLREKMLLLKQNGLLYKKEMNYIKTTIKTENSDNFWKNWKIIYWVLFILFSMTLANLIIWSTFI